MNENLLFNRDESWQCVVQGKEMFASVQGKISLLTAILLVGGVCYYCLRHSTEPGRLFKKFIGSGVTILVAGFLMYKFGGVSTGGMAGDYGVAMVIVGIMACGGVTLGIIWAENIGDLISRPFDNLFSGGNEELKPQAFYAIAEAQRKQGRTARAIAEVRKQLALFPNDFRGMMMLAEIQAEDQGDLVGAQETIERLLAETHPGVVNYSYALNRLADWLLTRGENPLGASEVLERITKFFPNTEQAMSALQRIAHLSDPEAIAAARTSDKITLIHREERIGLKPGYKPTDLVKPDDPAERAAELVRQLEAHPYDNEAREKLAMIYARELDMADVAVEQLEQLVAQPNQGQKHVVRWLNMIADVHVKQRGDAAGARFALERIIELSQGTSLGELARTRLALILKEIQGAQAGTTVQMGVYEQDIGLKQGRPRDPGESGEG